MAYSDEGVRKSLNLFAPSSKHKWDPMLKPVSFDLSTPLTPAAPRYFLKICDGLGAVGQKLRKLAIFLKKFRKNFSRCSMLGAQKPVRAIKKIPPSWFRRNFDILNQIKKISKIDRAVAKFILDPIGKYTQKWPKKVFVPKLTENASKVVFRGPSRY